MGQTYKATGINLKSVPMGESDRLLTVLTREMGLIRVVAPAARKPNSELSGRSGLFVVNELLVNKGRSLDKITHAETLEFHRGLSRDLGKLTAAQYLAELTLYQALSHHPQEDLFCLLSEHLNRLEHLNPRNASPAASLLALLTHGAFHLMALAGVAPQVQSCCLSEQPLVPDLSDPNWRVGFSITGGGAVSKAELERLKRLAQQPAGAGVSPSTTPPPKPMTTETTTQRTPVQQKPLKIDTHLNALDLTLLQQLAQPRVDWPDPAYTHLSAGNYERSWVAVERILRQYAQYHLDRSIRSAPLIDSYIASLPISPSGYDATF